MNTAPYEEPHVTLEQRLLDKLRHLPDDKQRELLDFAEFLDQRSAKRKPGKSLRGLWTDLQVEDLSEEQLRELRRQMWAKFPRDDV